MARKKARRPNENGLIAGYVRKSDVRFPDDCIGYEARKLFVEHLRNIRIIELTEDARRDGIEIASFYDDMDISGRGEFIEKRIAFAQMRDDALTGKIKRIYARDLSRLFRNLMQQEVFFAEMEEAGVEVRVQGLPPATDSHSVAMRQMFGAFNQWRATNDGETIRRNNRAAVKDKHWIGRTKSIWGLSYNKQTKHFDLDLSTAHKIIRLCELFVSHRGNAHGLCTDLNKSLGAGDPEAFPTPTGLYWYPKEVLLLVGNPLYRRRTSYHDLTMDVPELIPEVVPADLIEQVDFWLAKRRQQLPAGSGRPPGRTIKYTYTGTLFCGHCGSPSKPVQSKHMEHNPLNTVYISWYCRAKHRANCLCPESAAFAQKRLEVLIGRGLQEALETGGSYFAEEAQKSTSRNRKPPKVAGDKDAAERALRQIETRRRRYYELFAAGVIATMDDLKPHLDQLSAEDALLRSQIATFKEDPRDTRSQWTKEQWREFAAMIETLWLAEPVIVPINWDKYDFLHKMGITLHSRAIPRHTTKGLSRQPFLSLRMEVSSLGLVGEHAITVTETAEELRKYNTHRSTNSANARWSNATPIWPSRKKSR